MSERQVYKLADRERSREKRSGQTETRNQEGRQEAGRWDEEEDKEGEIQTGS